MKQIVTAAVNNALLKFTGEAKALIENSAKTTVEEIKRETSKTYASTLKDGLKEAIDDRTTTATAKKVVIQFTADNDCCED